MESSIPSAAPQREPSLDYPSHYPPGGEILKLKSKHGQRLAFCEYELDDQKGMLVFRPADRNVLAASAKVGQGDAIAGLEVMLRNTRVWGDEKALDDTRVFLGISQTIERFNAPVEVILKNL